MTMSMNALSYDYGHYDMNISMTICSGIDGSRHSRSQYPSQAARAMLVAVPVDLRTGSRTRLLRLRLRLRYSLLVRVLYYSPHIRFAPHSFRPHTHSEIRLTTLAMALAQFNVRPIK